MARAHRDPRTKEELLDKAVSFDAGINFRALGDNVSVVRMKPHILRLAFPDTGAVFDLTVHIPRKEHKQAKMAAEPEPWEKMAAASIAKKTRRKTTRRAGRKQ